MRALPAAVASFAMATMAALAQGPESVAPATPTSLALPDLVTDADADGRLWVAGRSYKASFGQDGTLFAPYLGADAPRTFATRFGRAKVAVGGTELATHNAPPALADGFVAFAGEACTERYRIAAAGIEQQFVLSWLPNRGAVAVTVPVETEFAVTAADQGFRFANEHGAFGYGRAVAIDADGDRLDLETRWTGSGFVITVPEAFVATAALPLVIDPWLATAVSLANSSYRLVETDMAYDESLGVYAVSWERVFSATDGDVYLQYFDGQMAAVGTPVAIDLSVTSWRRPRLAGLNGHDKFLVAAQVSTGDVSPFRIGGRIATGSPVVLGGQLNLAQGLGTDLLHPDVGGDPNASGSWLVVYEQAFSPSDHDIYCRLVQSTGTLGTPTVVDGSLALDVLPVVTKGCGTSGGYERWGVVCQRHLGNGTCQPMFATVSRGGSVLGALQPVGNAIPATAAQLTVAGPSDAAVGRRFLFGYVHSTAGGTASRYHALDLYGGVVASSFVSTSSLLVGNGFDSDCDGLRFVVVRSGEFNTAPGTFFFNTLLLGIVGANLQFQDSEGMVPGGPSLRAAAVVSNRTGGGGIEGAHGVACIEDTGAATNRVQVRSYRGHQAGFPLDTRMTGCGPTIGFSGSTAMWPGGTVSLSLSAAPGLLGMIAGFPVDLPIGPCPGCRQGAAGDTLFGTTLHFVIPRDAGLVGVTLSMQPFQILPSGGGACLGDIVVGNTLDMTIR